MRPARSTPARGTRLTLGTNEGFTWSYDLTQPYGDRVPGHLDHAGRGSHRPGRRRTASRPTRSSPPAGTASTAFLEGTAVTTGPVDVDVLVEYFETRFRQTPPVAVSPPPADHGTPLPGTAGLIGLLTAAASVARRELRERRPEAGPHSVGAGLRRRIAARHRPGRGGTAGRRRAARLRAPAGAPRAWSRRRPDRPERRAAGRPGVRPHARRAGGSSRGRASTSAGRRSSSSATWTPCTTSPRAGRVRSRSRSPGRGRWPPGSSAPGATAPSSTPGRAATSRSPSRRGWPHTSPRSPPGCPGPSSSCSWTSPPSPPSSRAVCPP